MDESAASTLLEYRERFDGGGETSVSCIGDSSWLLDAALLSLGSSVFSSSGEWAC